MAENQEDIDALLAEVNALADEAVADIVGEEPSDPSNAGTDDTVFTTAPAKAPSKRNRPAKHRPAIKSDQGENVNRILNLQVPVIVQLAERTMALSTIVNLSTGALLEFEKPSDSELDLMINNKCIGRGNAVKVGENFGLRINDIGTLRERIEALGDNQHNHSD